MTWDPVHDGRTTFLACMRALCSPGAPIEIPSVPNVAERPELDRAAAVLLALLDHGLGLATYGGDAARQVAAAVRATTGAGAADLGTADWVLVDGPPGAAISQARRGTCRNPESGATLVIATAEQGRPLPLAGPGLRQPTTCSVPLHGLAVQALSEANSNPPTGVDVLIVTPQWLIGLPRSVAIQAVP